MLHEIAPYHYHVEFRSADPEPDDYICLFFKGGILVRDTAEIDLPRVKEIEPYLREIEGGRPLSTGSKGIFTFLFSIDQMNFFAVPGASVDAPEGFVYRTNQELRRERPQHMVYAATMASQINKWYVSHRFCGRCGAKNTHSTVERAIVCPECGNLVYPQICPSVIIGIRNGDKLLCTQYNPMHNPGSRSTPNPAKKSYALVAGYVESGETPEDAVHRETMEEVGLKVKNLQYYKSQPWPFSGALLMGYVCDLDGDDRITLEEDELSLAEWVPRDELPDRSGDISLTSEIMENFRKGLL